METKTEIKRQGVLLADAECLPCKMSALENMLGKHIKYKTSEYYKGNMKMNTGEVEIDVAQVIVTEKYVAFVGTNGLMAYMPSSKVLDLIDLGEVDSDGLTDFGYKHERWSY